MKSEKDWLVLAAEFDELQEYVAGKESTLIIKKKISELPALGRVLELGCGNGGYTIEVAKRADSVVAADISMDMIQAATEKLKDCPNVTVEIADCYQLPYADASFDTVMMANLIHVVAHPDKIIQEARRLLKEHGRMVIMTFTIDGMASEEVTHMFERYLKAFGAPAKNGTPFSLSQLKEFVNTRGFEVLSAELIGIKTKAIFMVAERNQ